MKVLVKFGNGPTRSLNRIIGAILVAVAAAGFFYVTDLAIDAEIAHNDLVVSDHLSKNSLRQLICIPAKHTASSRQYSTKWSVCMGYKQTEKINLVFIIA